MGNQASKVASQATQAVKNDAKVVRRYPSDVNLQNLTAGSTNVENDKETFENSSSFVQDAPGASTIQKPELSMDQLLEKMQQLDVKDRMVAENLKDIRFERLGHGVKTVPFNKPNEFANIVRSRPMRRKEGPKKMLIADVEALLQQAHQVKPEEVDKVFQRFNISKEDAESLVRYFAVPEMESEGGGQGSMEQGKVVAKWPSSR